MARACPRDEIRALVEGIDQESGDSVAVLAHVEGCASCRRFKTKLEAKEKAFRSALAAFGSEEGSSRCPDPAEIATVAEKGLDEADQKLVDHIARCGSCRLTLVSIGETAQTARALEESEAGSLEETTVAAVKRRVAVARTKSDAKRSGSSGRVPSGRRARTTRQVALLENQSSRLGLVIAAAACFVVAFVFFAVVHDGSEPQQEANSTPSAPVQQPKQTPVQKPTAPSLPAPKPIKSQETPQAPAPAPTNNEDQVTAQVTPPPPVEEEPRETQPEQVQPVQQPEQPANKPETNKPSDQPATAPATPPKPGTPPRVDRGELASIKLDAVIGPVEIRKKAEKSWKKLLISDLVQEGDALRAKGEDASVTFSGKAKVSFDGEATGTLAITSSGVRINLESGGLEGESLAYNGLEIAEANGVVTAWKGSKLRVECGGEKGVRVAVERGTANVSNDLGKVTVHSGHEISVSKDKKPTRESETRVYRTPRK